ncbi:hypothetical protein GCM10010261_52570 [Streptomyces pilosus]|uniref:hypothetical protein n=1 Tax=Streptomyces pilosus TaxID=28893 RepID=UPI001671BCA1|nr:hypothetical protein [Streptomyces pilosus]GGV62897.1 hypothetical protein GCM10010261_52570 [Streptomyces pilosus]
MNTNPALGFISAILEAPADRPAGTVDVVLGLPGEPTGTRTAVDGGPRTSLAWWPRPLGEVSFLPGPPGLPRPGIPA